MKDENMTALETRIAALEAWKAECDERSQRILNGLRQSAEKHEARHEDHNLPPGVIVVPLSDSQPIGFDKRFKIDWEKVAEMAISRSHRKWNDVDVNVQVEIVKDVKAAVAEYLRQVKEGGK